MALKTENLSSDLLKKIQDLQTESNSIVYDLGQISVRFRELENEKIRIQNIKDELDNKLDNQQLQLENIFTDIQKKYKNAEIDLKEGTVTFEVAD